MRKGEKMKISEFFEYNNQQVLEENENILEYLEQIFGKSTEIDREGKKEFTFGKVIGLVTDSFLDEKTKRQKVSMLLCDADSKLLLWNGRPVEILRTNPENRLEEKKLIMTEPLESDRRYKKIVLTDKSSAMTTAIEEKIGKITERIFAGLSMDEIESLSGVIKKLTKNIK